MVKEEIIKESCDVDSFYLTPCLWPSIVIKSNHPKEYLIQLEHIMGEYEKCYTRHNSLVNILNKGGLIDGTH